MNATPNTTLQRTRLRGPLSFRTLGGLGARAVKCAGARNLSGSRHRDNHVPPGTRASFFHARYAGQKITVRIADGGVQGSFPPHALGHVMEVGVCIVQSWRRIGAWPRKVACPRRSTRWSRSMVDVVEARYVRDHTVWLKFEDGEEGEVDLRRNFTGRSSSCSEIRCTSDASSLRRTWEQSRGQTAPISRLSSCTTNFTCPPNPRLQGTRMRAPMSRKPLGV